MAYWSCELPPDLLAENAEVWAQQYFGTSYRPVRLVGSIYSEDPFGKECLDLTKAAELFGISSEDAALGVLDRCAEIHERYAEWSSRYTDGELNRGLWRMFSLPRWFGDLILDDSLPFAPRERLIRSLELPYRAYVTNFDSDVPMENGWYMAWDLIFGYRHPAPELGAVALEVLENILALPDDRCRSAALHGLNHLAHPGRPDVVQRYIDHHSTPESISMLEAMRDGTAM